MRKYYGKFVALQFLQNIAKSNIISFEKITPLFILDIHCFD